MNQNNKFYWNSDLTLFAVMIVIVIFMKLISQ